MPGCPVLGSWTAGRSCMNPALYGLTWPFAPPSGLSSAHTTSWVPAMTNTIWPPGRSAASQDSGHGRTENMATIVSKVPGSSWAVAWLAHLHDVLAALAAAEMGQRQGRAARLA